MPDPLRIVIDTSAIVPAFFPDGTTRVDQGAASLLAAIEHSRVVAFAPEVLQAELLKRAARRLDELVQTGIGRGTAVASVEGLWLRFLRARIVYTPAAVLAAIAWDATCRYSAPAPDSWFVACAIHHDAVLWMSHPPKDRAGEQGRRYGADVRYLSQDKADFG